MLRGLAVLTSGGDNAGLNAAIRAITRTAISRGIKVFGVHRGYLGLRDGQIEPLDRASVAGKLEQGGTWLGTARFPEWREKRIRREAIRQLNRHGIEGLIVIGGNGSLTGANLLANDGFPTIGIPGSIDDDVKGTEVCVGVDSALNILIEAIDRIRDCASSIQRAFIVEVMGRDSGALALMAASAAGAEVCLVPELPSADMEAIAARITGAYIRGKPHCILVVAEGCKPGTKELVKFLNDHQETTGFDVRTTVLGYTQRGGAPTYRDRFYATVMGIEAVNALCNGESGKMVGVVKGKLTLVPLETLVGELKPLDKALYDLYHVLDR
jgi:6-phosphofructokinase 1